MKINDPIDAEDLRLGGIAKQRYETSKPEDFVTLEEAVEKLGVTQ